MRAWVARPTTVVPTSRAPTAARACKVRRAPAGETTSSEPCCFATTIPLKPDAPAAAGQNAATAPMTASTVTIPFFMSLLQLVPAPAKTGFPKRGEGAEKLAADLVATCGRGRRAPAGAERGGPRARAAPRAAAPRHSARRPGRSRTRAQPPGGDRGSHRSGDRRDGRDERRLPRRPPRRRRGRGTTIRALRAPRAARRARLRAVSAGCAAPPRGRSARAPQ